MGAPQPARPPRRSPDGSPGAGGRGTPRQERGAGASPGGGAVEVTAQGREPRCVLPAWATWAPLGAARPRELQVRARRIPPAVLPAPARVGALEVPGGRGAACPCLSRRRPGGSGAPALLAPRRAGQGFDPKSFPAGHGAAGTRYGQSAARAGHGATGTRSKRGAEHLRRSRAAGGRTNARCLSSRR